MATAKIRGTREDDESDASHATASQAAQYSTSQVESVAARPTEDETEDGPVEYRATRPAASAAELTSNAIDPALTDAPVQDNVPPITLSGDPSRVIEPTTEASETESAESPVRGPPDRIAGDDETNGTRLYAEEKTAVSIPPAKTVAKSPRETVRKLSLSTRIISVPYARPTALSPHETRCGTLRARARARAIHEARSDDFDEIRTARGRQANRA